MAHLELYAAHQLVDKPVLIRGEGNYWSANYQVPADVARQGAEGYAKHPRFHLEREVANETHYYIVAWEHGRIVLIEIHEPGAPVQGYNKFTRTFSVKQHVNYGDAPLWVFMPLDPSVAYVDVDNAPHFKVNATKTGWLFYHADEDWHYDFEYVVDAAVDSLFARELEALNEQVITKLVVALGAAHGSNAKSNAMSQLHPVRAKWNTLFEVKNHLRTVVEYFAQQMHIGYAHQNPLESHIHAIIKRELPRVVTSWQNDTKAKPGEVARASRIGTVSVELGRITKRANHEHEYKTRAEKAAAVKAIFTDSADASGQDDSA